MGETKDGGDSEIQSEIETPDEWGRDFPQWKKRITWLTPFPHKESAQLEGQKGEVEYHREKDGRRVIVFRTEDDSKTVIIILGESHTREAGRDRSLISWPQSIEQFINGNWDVQIVPRMKRVKVDERFIELIYATKERAPDGSLRIRSTELTFSKDGLQHDSLDFLHRLQNSDLPGDFPTQSTPQRIAEARQAARSLLRF